MFTLRVALRYLFSKKTHNAVNVISTISIIGVAVATMAIVCVLSVFNGFTDLATAKISQLAPDLRVESTEGKTIASPDSLLRAIRAIEGVAAAAPTIEEHALAIYGDRQMPVLMKGVTEAFDTITQLRSTIKEDGTFLLTDSGYGDFATLSVGAAIGLQAHPGVMRALTLNVPRRTGRINPANPAAAFRSDSLLVGGVFQTEQAEFDTDLVLIPLSAARQLLDYELEATAIEIKVSDGADTDRTGHRIAEALGDGFDVKNRVRQQDQSFKMIEVEKWITFFLLAFILIIASFNIISSLSMLVLEKQSSLSTLSAMGMNRRQIGKVFFWESIFVSLTGGISGIATGIILVFLQERFGLIKIAGGGAITAYPVALEWSDVGITLIPVAAIGSVTAVITDAFARSRIN